MPSIQDVADQINAKLDGISQNTADTVAVGNEIRTDLAQLDNSVQAVDAHLQAGVAELSAGLFAIWELQKREVAVLEHLSKQTDTVICLLENSNELLCGITRKFTQQLDLSERQLTSTMRIAGILERAHPAAAGDFNRDAEVAAKLLACCPPEAPPIEPCPDACERPRTPEYKPEGQDWRPTHAEPVG